MMRHENNFPKKNQLFVPIADAKTEETKQRRIKKALSILLETKKLK